MEYLANPPVKEEVSVSSATTAQDEGMQSSTKLMIVDPTGNSLFTATGNFTIESVIAASTRDSYMQTTDRLDKQ